MPEGLTLQVWRRFEAEMAIEQACAEVLGEAHCPVYGDGVWQGWMRCGYHPETWHVKPIDWDLPVNREMRRRRPGWGQLAAPYEARNA